MYCKHCQYDLRGQIESRCPECGHNYDPDNPHTFEHELSRIPKWVVKCGHFTRRLCTAAFCVVLILAHSILLPNITRCGPTGESIAERSNLKNIIETWRDIAAGKPPPHNLDVVKLAESVGPQISLYSQADTVCLKRKWTRIRREWTPILIMYGFCSFIVFLVNSYKPSLARRVSGFVLLLSITIGIGFSVMDHRCRLTYKRDYSYLSDYAFVNGLDWSIKPNECRDVIVMFSRKPSPAFSLRRIVGFMDGHLESMSDTEFKVRAAQQGLGDALKTYDEDDLNVP